MEKVIISKLRNTFEDCVNNMNCVEKSIQICIHLTSSLSNNENIKTIKNDIEQMIKFLQEQLNIYNENLKITKKSRLELLTCLTTLEKLI